MSENPTSAGDLAGLLAALDGYARARLEVLRSHRATKQRQRAIRLSLDHKIRCWDRLVEMRLTFSPNPKIKNDD